MNRIKQIRSESLTRPCPQPHIGEMKTIGKVNRSGNQVAFLCGALLNVIIGIAQDGVSEKEWYLLSSAVIGGIVWILCNQLYQSIKFRWVKM